MKHSIILSLMLATSFAWSATSETFGGIGITIQTTAQGVQIVGLVPGTPAEAAGLLASDVITAVNGQTLVGLDIESAKSQLRGPVGSELELAVVRNGSVQSLRMQRVLLEVAPLESSSLQNWYGKDPGTYSGTEIAYLTSLQVDEGKQLLGILSQGKPVAESERVDAQALAGVFTLTEKQTVSFDKNLIATASLRSFDRDLLALQLASAGTLSAKLVDSRGRLVHAWMPKPVGAGILSMPWNGKNLSEGSYMLEVEHAGSVSSWPVVLR